MLVQENSIGFSSSPLELAMIVGFGSIGLLRCDINLGGGSGSREL
jgi:hypothetical protein